jgi:eukaryotic-like serine/threonine-protein kinase
MSVAITDPLVLSPDVLLLPVAELSEEVRSRFAHAEGDVALTHPRARTPSRVLDAQSAELVSDFKAPRTIVDAVIRWSRAHDADPETTLEEAYPLLQGLLDAGFLVPAGAPEAAGILPSLRPGEEIAGWTVRECVRGLEDTEVYLVEAASPPWPPSPIALPSPGFAALKIERPSPAGSLGGLLVREGAILSALAGEGAPRLLAAGELEGRRWLLLEWLEGVDANHAAWELRQTGDRSALLGLLRRIAAAYARLHERGAVHGDVHPHNLLIARDGAVRLLDFGYSRLATLPESLEAPGRGGVAYFYEPEQAAAMREGSQLPSATPAGEQYALAALLYLLAAGAHSRDFSLERAEMLRQVTADPPLSFAERGAAPWPQLEAVLARALAKTPEERFPSVSALAAALDRIEAPRTAASEWSRPGGKVDLETLLAGVLERVGEGGATYTAGLPSPPTATVNYGAAGIACALYRIALAREEPALLSLADVWAEGAARAARPGAPPEAFYNPALEITQETVGGASAYHSAAGAHAVRALIAHSLGFRGAQAEAAATFLEAARRPCPNPDLTLGRSGLVLTGALLLDTLAPGVEPHAALKTWGDELLEELWAELAARPPLDDRAERPQLGMAHGWTGYLYAALRWSRASGSPPPAAMTEQLGGRLAALAACARPSGRGVRFKWYATPEGAETMPGWCNGSAGLVFLGTLAAQVLGDPTWRVLAERAAWNAWEAPDGSANLCCGLAGRAYALLNLWRHGGGAEWLDRARLLAGQAARAIAGSQEPPDSLYKGELGIAVLAADLERPESAAMPFFEEEGWS